MKINSILWSSVALLILATGCHSNKEPERIFDLKYKKVLKVARQDAYFFQSRNFIPGSSIAVSIDGKLVWSEGIGQASTDLEVPATRFTKYRMGQITQVLTALAYYQLVEKGKISPQDDVRKYLPDFKEKAFPVRLQNLIDQTSGIRPVTEDESNFRGLNVNYMKAMENIAGDSLLFPPGMYQYPSFYCYNMIGGVLEKAGGMPFAKLISKFVTDTLDMRNTVPDNPLTTIKYRSDFYERNVIAQVINSTTFDYRYHLPAEGYLSTAEDLVKLGNALLSSPILSDSVKKWMVRPPILSSGEIPATWGNGLMIMQLRDGKTFYASRGLVKGSGAMLIMIPDKKIVLGWLSNLDDNVEELPGLKIAIMFKEFLEGTFRAPDDKPLPEENKENKESKENKENDNK